MKHFANRVVPRGRIVPQVMCSGFVFGQGVEHHFETAKIKQKQGARPCLDGLNED